MMSALVWGVPYKIDKVNDDHNDDDDKNDPTAGDLVGIYSS